MISITQNWGEVVLLVLLLVSIGGANASSMANQLERVRWQPGVEQPEPPKRWLGTNGRRRKKRQRQPNKQHSGQRHQTIKPGAEKQRQAATEQRKAEGEERSSPEPLPEAQTWVEEELGAVKLNDRRLERRLIQLMEQLFRQPTASIPQACGDWAGTKAAYRFFDNPKVSHAAILAGHREACLKRISQEEMILILQDTTDADYTHHPQTTGLGPIGHSQRQGQMVHNSLAVSEAGVPLGLLDQRVWTRDPERVGQRHQRRERPIEEKESYKWLLSLRASRKDIAQQVCVVTVADREADIYELFQEAEGETHVLVRAAWNRRLDGEKPDYLWEAVARSPRQGTFTVEVGRAQDRLPREATVAVRFTRVTLRPPKHRAKRDGLQPVTLSAIEVREEKPPPDQEALHWLLLTTWPVENLVDARRCARWYALRWLVERYHFVLKSGCRIEARQLATTERLQRCLAVYAIVAWRLLWLTYQARVTPDIPCTVVLQTHEWQALYCYIHRVTTPPAEPPSLNQAMHWIARLGGFLDRTHDGEPGVKTLWLGWQRLHDIAQGSLLARSPP